VYRCLKPGGQLIVSFASKNKLAEDKQIKVRREYSRTRSSKISLESGKILAVVLRRIVCIVATT
jgi:hypothetical protein